MFKIFILFEELLKTLFWILTHKIFAAQNDFQIKKLFLIFKYRVV